MLVKAFDAANRRLWVRRILRWGISEWGRPPPDPLGYSDRPRLRPIPDSFFASLVATGGFLL